MNTVLLVDDSVMLLNYLKEYLEKYQSQFRLITAKDGLEAIDILKEKQISLLVTDLQMPKIDGLGFSAYAHKYHSNIPCIVMSAHGTPKIIETITPDILQFIEKPFKAEKLASIIITALNRNIPGGSLSGISIVSFLQMIEMEQKTCLCEVESPGKPKGFFYFKSGQMYHAVYGSLKGVDAALKMITIEDPTINFRKVPERKIPRKINKELTALLLEATRMKDED